MLMLDTCALIWWTLEPEKLSTTARTVCDTMQQQGGFICSISIWEIGIKIKRKKLDLGLSVEEYVERLRRTNVIEIVPVDETIWLENVALDWDHKDPADRTIVATARLKKLPILTVDRSISTFYKETIW